MADETIGIVGAGIVGLATAREIALSRPGTRVVVFEKEREVALHQTGHNSGVVHAGIYYTPGSLKAELTVRGVALLRAYCEDRELPYREIGKLVVAVREDELGRMNALYDRARNNHVPELRKVSREEIREIEPNAGGVAALYSPRTAITDYPAIARAFAEDVTGSGGEVRTGFPVTSLTEVPGGIEVVSGPRRERVDRLILCAGLHSDTVAGLAQDRREPRIVPFRGEYMLLRPEKTDLVRGLIYPVPDPVTRSSASTSRPASTARWRSAPTRSWPWPGRGTPAPGSPRGTCSASPPTPASGRWRPSTGAPASRSTAGRSRRRPS